MLYLVFSRNHSYELARRGEIPVIKFGKRMVVPKAAFEKMLEYNIENKIPENGGCESDRSKRKRE